MVRNLNSDFLILNSLPSSFPQLFSRERRNGRSSLGCAAKIESVERRCGIGRSRGAVLDRVAAVLGHALGCEERERTAARRRETVGHEVVAVGIGKSIIATRSVGNAARDESIALCGIADA